MTERLIVCVSLAGLAGLLVTLMPPSASAQITAYAFVPNNTSNNVSKVQTLTNTVVGGPIAVGVNPHGAIVLPHGKSAYITNFDSNTVVAIDVINGAVRRVIPRAIVEPARAQHRRIRLRLDHRSGDGHGRRPADPGGQRRRRPGLRGGR
jgi:YVTN family beta-propeller protein